MVSKLSLGGAPSVLGSSPSPGASTARQRPFNSKTLFLLGLLVAGSGVISAPIALLGGVAFGFAVEHPFRAESARLSRLLLQPGTLQAGP